jgi:hypothetical protein
MILCYVWFSLQLLCEVLVSQLRNSVAIDGDMLASLPEAGTALVTLAAQTPEVSEIKQVCY